MNHRQRHGESGGPHGLVFEVPGHLVDAAVGEGVTGDGVAALDGQWLAKHDVVVRSVSSTASGLLIDTSIRS